MAYEINGRVSQVLNPEALRFLTELHNHFEEQRQEILLRRIERQKLLEKGIWPSFLKETENLRKEKWQVAPPPTDLQDRRVEITGPVERKMIINAMNSGAKVFMADFEDSLSPTWENVIQGQENLVDAVNKTLEFKSPEGKTYKLKSQTSVLVVRPRGWHLIEDHFLVEGKSISASLFDFGLYFFLNSKKLLEDGTGPYFYLPKMESHLEARLWNDVFNFSQDYLKIPRGKIRATVLIETILAAFEMDEILFELRNHIVGLNAGRWDYIFSCIKKFRTNKEIIFPDRNQVSMTVPFMRAYTKLLVSTCHKRGAHAMGGMAAFIPSRKDAKVNEVALAKVREDKLREVGDGFDGTWVAHPDLVPIAQEIFDSALKDRPNQKDKMSDDFKIDGSALIDFKIPNSTITEQGMRNNISVALQYLESWLKGQGAVGIFNLMEDAATAEISRSELWQWVHHGAKLDDGRKVTVELYKEFRLSEVKKLSGLEKFNQAIELLDGLVLTSDFPEFLTKLAYGYL